MTGESREYFRVLICGDRHWVGTRLISRELKDLQDIWKDKLIVIAGGAAGADSIAARVARKKGIHVAEVEALWSIYGRSAGPKRNLAMLALHPHLVLAFHDDIENSKGTANMLKIAEAAGITTKVKSHTAPVYYE